MKLTQPKQPTRCSGTLEWGTSLLLPWLRFVRLQLEVQAIYQSPSRVKIASEEKLLTTAYPRLEIDRITRSGLAFTPISGAQPKSQLPTGPNTSSP
ncbi:hypothetical protein Ae201684P_015750 [Aphanomyces euteiches]|nr:hypothetical protein Ae201684P_015750 [Aphanomyces euteiches]